MKALGLSIGFELNRLSFKIATLKLDKINVMRNTRLRLDGKYLENFLFEELLLDDKHCVSVALMSDQIPQNDEEVIKLKN